ncbi:S8 family peptidase [Pseudoalteromonas sp. BDTF-M6]|uniref:S8 family peptidase n=1 Tax=Pseudoalteromonas sp. BDTF-M6 TaxID=2796132 RepID=UPI001BB0B547|nr:S8 family peptidase [Pseudoalteromonas sp. BDTF-M6]MBS3796353.1 S8 family peptidase [Pseudoalteromonas sp. BDTF-M6]
MQNKSLIALLVATAFSANAELIDNPGATADRDVRVVFEYHQGNKAKLVSAIEDAGGLVIRELDSDNSFAATINADVFAQIKDNKAIKSAEFDAKRYAIPQMEDASANFEDYTPYGLAMVQADQLKYLGGIKVCVVDTGYDLGHGDLPSSTVDGDSEGAGPWYQDGHGHGTHVAGTIAGVDGNGGLTGVIGSGAPELHIVRVFDDFGGYVYASDLADAVNDCADAGAKVINMSLGGAFATKVEERAFARIERSGVLAIAAAGNDRNATHNYPASYDSVVSVAAIDKNMEWAFFSQRTAKIEVAAPGVGVVSTVPRDAEGQDLYASYSGTSMASPHVAGVAALVWSHFPHCNNYEIRNALSASAKDLGEQGRDYKFGYGLVQAKAAHDYLTENNCDGRGVK